jgi:hypothetical protein
MAISTTLKDHIMRHTLFLAQRYFVTAIRTVFVVALALLAISATYVLYILMRRRIREYRSPLRSIPGPKNAQWLKGSFVDVPEVNSLRLQEEWVKTYGHVLKYYSFFGVRVSFLFSEICLYRVHLQNPKLLAFDPVAISYILQNDDTFQKAEFTRYIFSTITGRGMDNSSMFRCTIT